MPSVPPTELPAVAVEAGTPGHAVFELERVVAGLRQARERWRASQQRALESAVRELPDRARVAEIVEALAAVLFPLRLGPPDLKREGEDYFVGSRLDFALHALLGQVKLELQHAARLGSAAGAAIDPRATAIVREFAGSLPEIRALLDTDVLAAWQGDPAARSVDEVLLCYPGIIAVIHHRQSVSHMAVDVQQIGADFFVFSGHKVFGPTGIGVVYGRRAVLEEMPPWQGGGNMIADVTFERTVFQPPPNKFEAGTGNIADAVGLGAAIDYVQRLGMATIAAYEHGLLEYAARGLRTIPGLRLVGTAPDKASVLSFVLAGYRTEEVGQALNDEGIAVRSGHHCAQPILRRFGLEATVRPSLAFYNTCDEVDLLVSVVRRLANRR